jgi:outer membrane immunogenic protein
MKKLMIAAASISLAMAGIAQAADMLMKAPPPAPVYNWTGWYVGLNGGGAWTTNQSAPFSGAGPAAPLFFAVDAYPSSVPLTSKGGFGGFQTGYNWQVAPMWLVGVETDIQVAHIAGTTTVTSIPPLGVLPPFTTQVLTESDWFGTLRARLGLLATSTILVYGTGGLAYGETSTGLNTAIAGGNCTGVVPCANGFSSSNRTGWAAGGGLEWMFAPRWTLRAEYLHIDLGTQSATVAPFTPGGPLLISSFTTSSTFQQNIARAAVNFGF